MVTLVLLPGMDGTGELFSEFISCLGQGIKPLIVPYPKNEPLGYVELEAFVKNYLPIDEHFILLGESFSGPIAISLAASKPPGLIGLILCCTFVRNPIAVLRPLRSLIRILPFTRGLVSLISPLLLGSFCSIKRVKALKQVLDTVSTITLQTRVRAVLEVDVSEKLKDVEVPTLYLQATTDRIVPPSAFRYIKILFPEIRVATLSGPHLLLQAKPSEAATIARNFIVETSQKA